MNNVTLKPLTIEYKQSVIELFIECFKDSHFYNERIIRIQNDSSRNQVESSTEEVQQVQIQLPKICR